MDLLVEIRQQNREILRKQGMMMADMKSCSFGGGRRLRLPDDMKLPVETLNQLYQLNKRLERSTSDQEALVTKEIKYYFLT